MFCVSRGIFHTVVQNSLNSLPVITSGRNCKKQVEKDTLDIQEQKVATPRKPAQKALDRAWGHECPHRRLSHSHPASRPSPAAVLAQGRATLPDTETSWA